MQNNFKKIQLILPIVIFFILLGSVVLLYREINLNNEKAEALNTELENENVKRNEIKLLNNSIKTIKEDGDLLGTHFAQSSNIVPFLNTVEELAGKVGAEAETTSVDMPADKTSLVVSIKAVGSFTSIYKFLTLLENSPYELEFLGFDIKKGNVTETVLEGDSADVLVVREPKWEATFNIKLLSFIQ